MVIPHDCGLRAALGPFLARDEVVRSGGDCIGVVLAKRTDGTAAATPDCRSVGLPAWSLPALSRLTIGPERDTRLWSALRERGCGVGGRRKKSAARHGLRVEMEVRDGGCTDSRV